MTSSPGAAGVFSQLGAGLRGCGCVLLALPILALLLVVAWAILHA